VTNAAKTPPDIFCEILERIDNRCLAADGPVPPTLREATDQELRALYVAADAIRKIDRVRQDESPIPDVSMQNLIDVGLNAFGLQMFVESIANKKDAAGFSPITFRFRGIRVTMQPDGKIDTRHH
jgi:hypothetical protein